MEHIAIDLGGKKSQVCVREGGGEIVDERAVPTRGLRAYLASRTVPGRVTMETCAEAFAVADAARELGHEVQVVPSMLVRSLGVGARGVKTDERDARVLSEASCRMRALPAVHVPSREARERKTVCAMREALVSARTQLINTARGYLRQSAIQLPGGASHTFGLRVRKLYREKLATAVPTFLERQLRAIDALTGQIDEADREVAELAQGNPVCRRLMTMSGVGPVVSVSYVAALDEVGRFQSAHQLESYLGLTPGEHSSSERTRRTGITKAGAPRVRAVLTQAAWTLRRCRPEDPMVRWMLRVEERRGKRIAVIALVRKMAGVLYAMWRDGTVYDPARGARVLVD